MHINIAAIAAKDDGCAPEQRIITNLRRLVRVPSDKPRPATLTSSASLLEYSAAR